MSKKIDFILILATALVILVSGVIKPKYNWDIIGYVASAYSRDGIQDEKLSQLVYSDVQKEVGPEKFSSMIEGEYHNTVYADPNSLSQHLPFYAIRVAYVELIRSLSLLDISYSKATYIISAFSACFSVFLLGALCRVGNVSIKWLPLIVLLSGYGTVARLSTPDALTCFSSLLALYLLATHNSLYLLVAAMLPLIRTDYVILSLLVSYYGFFSGKKSLSIICVIASCSIYWTINYSMKNYGWLTIFNFSLIGLDPYPKEMKISGDISAYVTSYLNGLKDLLKHKDILIYMPALIILLIKSGHKFLKPEFLTIAKISALFLSIHMMLFPAYENRFFIFVVSTLLISSISSVISKRSLKNSFPTGIKR